MMKDLDINTDSIYGQQIATALENPEELSAQDELAELTTRKERKTYSAQEVMEALNTGKTAGKKGMKLPRINLAFQKDVYDYVKTMANVRGETLTDFINHELRKSMEENAEIYKKAIEFRNSF